MLRGLLKALREDITAELLNETYALKSKVSRALVQVEGAKEALEKVQADEAAMQVGFLGQIARCRSGSAIWTPKHLAAGKVRWWCEITHLAVDEVRLLCEIWPAGDLPIPVF